MQSNTLFFFQLETYQDRYLGHALPGDILRLADLIRAKSEEPYFLPDAHGGTIVIPAYVQVFGWDATDTWTYVDDANFSYEQPQIASAVEEFKEREYEQAVDKALLEQLSQDPSAVRE